MAGKLQLGEPVQRVDGSVAVVVALTMVHGTAPMWDLTVSQVHDFAVGDGAYVVHNCNFKTFHAKNGHLFESKEESRAVFNTIKRAENGDKSLWPKADGKPWDNSTAGAIRRGTGRRSPLKGNPLDYKEWTVHFGETEPGNNAARGFRRILTGHDGSVWFTRSHTTGWVKLRF